MSRSTEHRLGGGYNVYSIEARISMDGKGRVIDNIFIERFWKTLKYEEVYAKCYESVLDCKRNLGEYTRERRRQSLKEYETPFEA
jgi:putative transposase